MKTIPTLAEYAARPMFVQSRTFRGRCYRVQVTVRWLWDGDSMWDRPTIDIWRLPARAPRATAFTRAGTLVYSGPHEHEARRAFACLEGGPHKTASVKLDHMLHQAYRVMEGRT